MDIVGCNMRDELLKWVVDSVSHLCAEVGFVDLEKESFQRFSKYIELLRTLLQELTSQRIDSNLDCGTTITALKDLELQVNKARDAIKTHKERSRLHRLLRCRSTLHKLQQSAKGIWRALEQLQLGNLDSGLQLVARADAIIHGLESVEFKSAAATEAIAAEIDKLLAETERSWDQTANLLQQIADAVGASTSDSLGREIALLKQEKEEMEARKQHAEALQLAQLIHLLDRTEIIRSPSATSPRSLTSDNLIRSFTCPISGEVMETPVAIICGHSFEKKAIIQYFGLGQETCPVCGEVLRSKEIIRNISLQNSIQEWKNRDTEFKLRRAVVDLASNEPQALNQAIQTLLAAMEMPTYVAEISELNPIPKLVLILRNSDVDYKSTLKCLGYLAHESDQNKEAIARGGAVRCIVKKFCRGETQPEALQILLDLAENDKFVDVIGNTKDCIPSLVSLVNNSDPAIAEKAAIVLEKLSSKTAFVIKMAEAGLIQPFLTSFHQANKEGIAQMAAALARMQLLEKNSKYFEDEQFISTLTRSLFSCSCKPSCLSCLKKLSAFPGIVQKLLLDRDVIPALLGLLHSTISEPQWKQDALEILITLLRTSQPDDYSNNSSLQELESQHNIHVFLHIASTSSYQTKSFCFSLLNLVAKKSSDAQQLIRSDESMIDYLFSTLVSDQRSDVRLQVLKLIYNVSKEHPDGVPLQASPKKEAAVNTLINIFTSSTDVDERWAAAGIIGHFPSGEESIDEILYKSEALKAMHEIICDAAHKKTSEVSPWRRAAVSDCLLENVLASLPRFLQPGKSELWRQLLKLNLSTALVGVLSVASPLAKKHAIIALSHLSQLSHPQNINCGIDLEEQRDLPSTVATVDLRRMILELTSWCGFSSSTLPESLCSVHGSACAMRAFCLVKDGALRPLVQAVAEAESEACEVALAALENLVREDKTVTSAAMAIAESQGVAAILSVLCNSKSPLSTKEKALDLLLVILKHSGTSKVQSLRTREVLINLLKLEELKKKVALVLSQMNAIPYQSSYF